MLLCNYTDQGVRTIKDVPKRRAAAQELGKKLGIDIKAGYLAIGTYDLIIHAESASDDAMAKFLLSLASRGNVRTTTVKVFGQEESDKIIGPLCKPEGGRRNHLGARLAGRPRPLANVFAPTQEPGRSRRWLGRVPACRILDP